MTTARGVHLGGAVRPDLRGRGWGRTILAWEMAHARAWDAATRREGYGALVMRLYAPVDQSDVRDLAQRHGIAVERYFFELSRPLERPIEVAAPDGVRLSDWDPQRSDEVHALINTAFAEHWAHVDSTPQMWADQIGAQSFRPGWSVLAVDERTGAVVGAALNAAYDQDWTVTHRAGYTDELGVLSTYRGRGVASALLQESARRFATDGMTAAELGVDADNTTGALRLYESLGYRRTAATCAHQLVEQAPTGSAEP